MAALNSEMLAWAESVGIPAARALWLASCPKFTRWEYQTRTPADRNLWLNGGKYFFRAKVNGVQIVENLRTADVTEARRLRDARILALSNPDQHP
jgi:hypothetical protein